MISSEKFDFKCKWNLLVETGRLVGGGLISAQLHGNLI